MLNKVAEGIPGINAAVWLCSVCRVLQFYADGNCPWCSLDHDKIASCRVPHTEETQRAAMLALQGEPLPIPWSRLMKAPRRSVTERVELAKRQGTCAPIVPGALYWDMPGTVGLEDGVTHRHAYMDTAEGTIEVFLLEAGPNGRLFAHVGNFFAWLKNWYHVGDARVLEDYQGRWLEVDLRQYFGEGRMAWWQSEFAARKTSRLHRVMAVCLGCAVPEMLPGHLPKLGFEWGTLQVVPPAYNATWRNFADMDEANNPVFAHTWGNVMLSLGAWSVAYVVDTFLDRVHHHRHSLETFTENNSELTEEPENTGELNDTY